MSHSGLACARLKDCLANAHIFSIWKPAEKIENERTDSNARECVCVEMCVSWTDYRLCASLAMVLFAGNEGEKKNTS